MSSQTKRNLDTIAAIGIAFGAVFGLAGTMVAQSSLRQLFWAIDGVGLIVACSLLTMKFFRLGQECVAAGFLVFAIGESHLVSGTAAGLEASVPSFAGGVALWAAALFLISIPKSFATWVRIAGSSTPPALCSRRAAFPQGCAPGSRRPMDRADNE